MPMMTVKDDENQDMLLINLRCAFSKKTVDVVTARLVRTPPPLRSGYARTNLVMGSLAVSKGKNVRHCVWE